MGRNKNIAVNDGSAAKQLTGRVDKRKDALTTHWSGQRKIRYNSCIRSVSQVSRDEACVAAGRSNDAKQRDLYAVLRADAMQHQMDTNRSHAVLRKPVGVVLLNNKITALLGYANTLPNAAQLQMFPCLDGTHLPLRLAPQFVEQQLLNLLAFFSLRVTTTTKSGEKAVA